MFTYEWVQCKVAERVRSRERDSDNPFFLTPPILAFLESLSSGPGIYELGTYIFNYEHYVLLQKACFYENRPRIHHTGHWRAFFDTIVLS